METYFAKNVIHYREKARRSRRPYESVEAYVKDQQWNWNRALANEQYIIDYANRLLRWSELETRYD